VGTLYGIDAQAEFQVLGWKRRRNAPVGNSQRQWKKNWGQRQFRISRLPLNTCAAAAAHFYPEEARNNN